MNSELALTTNRSIVAQISNLLYRGFPIRQRVEVLARSKLADAQPNGIRRHSRLEICATVLLVQRALRLMAMDFFSSRITHHV